jgi:hypothetical protein
VNAAEESSVMEERLRLVARLPDAATMTDGAGGSADPTKLATAFSTRYRNICEAFGDRSRRPVRYANQLPPQLECLIVTLKREKASP